jgi:antitoxin (DNA-binding transcriptional repressor) of toxin-antitoxin stability system
MASYIVITNDGEPVAQLVPPRPKVILGTMRDRIKLLPGWDAPFDEEDFPGLL